MRTSDEDEWCFLGSRHSSQHPSLTASACFSRGVEIPHCILVDSHGIVRYEGMPGHLDANKLEQFLDKHK